MTAELTKYKQVQRMEDYKADKVHYRKVSDNVNSRHLVYVCFMTISD